MKKKLNPNWYLVFGIFFLLVPTAIYLGFLIPAMKDEYIVLMSSGGVIGGAGMLGAEVIPDKVKFGTLYKTASKSFTLLVVITLVKDFMPQLIGLAVVIVVSYIVFLVFKELWKDGKRAKENVALAEEVARRVTQVTE